MEIDFDIVSAALLLASIFGIYIYKEERKINDGKLPFDDKFSKYKNVKA
jgi:hypothetical protein